MNETQTPMDLVPFDDPERGVVQLRLGTIYGPVVARIEIGVLGAPAAALDMARMFAAAPALLEALERSRGQWIHSVNAESCLAAIAEAKP